MIVTHVIMMILPRRVMRTPWRAIATISARFSGVRAGPRLRSVMSLTSLVCELSAVSAIIVDQGKKRQRAGVRAVLEAVSVGSPERGPMRRRAPRA